MKKRLFLAAAAFVTSAFVSNATAASPALECFNSWHGTKAMVVYVTKYATKFDGDRYGSEMMIRTGNTNSDGVAPDRWYEIGAGADYSSDAQLFYKDTDGKWKNLSDDEGGNRNFKAVVYVPQKNRRRTRDLWFQASYCRPNTNDKYWGTVTQHLEDPKLKVPYLIADVDGTLRRVVR